MKQSFIYRIAMMLTLLFGAVSAALAADRFYLESVNVEPGETKTLSFILDNDQPFYGFQTDITFPEGLNIVTSSAGKYDCSLSERFDSSFSLLVHPQSNGDIRFGAYSTNHTAIAGNSGALLYVTVQAAADFEGGMLSIHNSYFVTENDWDVELDDYSIAIGNIHENRCYIEDFRIDVGETKTIPILLDNETEFTAFQADLYLPEGLTADNFVVSARATGHSLTTKSYSDGRIRITCYSASNENFSGNSGEILSFSLTAASNLAETSEIELKNIYCSTESAKEFILPNSSALVLTSNQIPMSSIEFNLDSVTLGIGETYSIKYSVFPEYASNKDVEWTSSNPEVAIVSEEGGVTAISEGSAVITATAVDGSGVSASCEVTVQKSTVDVASIALDDISISISNGYIEIKGLPSGAFVQLTDIAGRVIAREVAVDSSMSLSVNGEKIVILSIGEYSWKLAAN